MPEQTTVVDPPSSIRGSRWMLIVLIVLSLVIILVILAIGIMALLSQLPKSDSSSNTDTTPQTDQTDDSNSFDTQTAVSWSFNGSKWSPSDTPPACTDPLEIATPISLDDVTAMLYPGQVRGGDYKPHGGFRLDDLSNNTLQVTLPVDATLYRGSRYVENDQIQYSLDFISACGIFIRFDHLLTLSSELMVVVDAQLPAAKVDDSSSTNFNPTITMEQGAVVATEIGFAEPNFNPSFDLGVYDLRQRNEISLNAAWAAEHADEKELGYYGICWLNNLPAADRTLVLSLPGSGSEGKNSDYCD